MGLAGICCARAGSCWMLRIRLPCWGGCGRPGSGCRDPGLLRGDAGSPPPLPQPGRCCGRGTRIAAGEAAGCSSQGSVCALGVSWVPLRTLIPSWAGLHTPEPDRDCKMSLYSRWLPAERSPLTAGAGDRGAGGGKGLGGVCVWCFGRAGTCRGELHLSVALGIPGRQLRVGRLTGVPFGCPCLWEGTGASPFFSCPFLPPGPS